MITNFDLSRDDRVVAAVPDGEGKSRLWLAWLDGREPPRRIGNIEGDAPRFGMKGEIFFRAADGNGHALMRVDENGSAPSKIAPVASFVFGNASPDGEWLSVWDQKSLSLYSSRSNAPIRVFDSPQVARIRWSGDGSRLYLSFQIGESSAFAVGRTYVIPLFNGSLPPIPAGGFRTEEQLAALPGVQVLPYADVGPGPTPEVYAFSRTMITRNLYRIPLP
jgi:hypothetical protein